MKGLFTKFVFPMVIQLRNKWNVVESWRYQFDSTISFEDMPYFIKDAYWIAKCLCKALDGYYIVMYIAIFQTKSSCVSCRVLIQGLFNGKY